MTIDRREFLRRAGLLGITISVPGLSACSDSAGALPRSDAGGDLDLSDTDGPVVDADLEDGGERDADSSDTDPDEVDDGLPRYEYDGPLGPETIFQHGLASGDPLSDSVILWTRLSHDDGGEPDMDVFLEVSLTPDFHQRVAASTFSADSDADATLHIDLHDLEPATTYYYRFWSMGRVSAIGRTRTAPAGATSRLRLGVVSCSNYGHGYFHAYRHIARRPDLDAVIHLGDYIYEHASEGHGRSYGVARPLEPLHEIVSLQDYRTRYAHYRLDPDLQEVHRQNPMIVIWDDHEFANNPEIGGAANHQPDTEGPWSDRVDAALQTFAEWMPTRIRDGNRIYRSLLFGDLVELVMLDRQRRFIWPEDDDADEYLGAEQAEWLTQVIVDSRAQWLVLGQGSTFSPHGVDMIGSSSWDAPSRRRVLNAVEDSGAENLLVLTGDIHRVEALDIVTDPDTYDPDTGEGSAGVELACGSITSPGNERSTEAAAQYKWSSAAYRGYLLIDLTPDRLHGEFYGFVDLLKLLEIEPPETFIRAFAADAGSNFLYEVDTPTPPRADAPELAPE